MTDDPATPPHPASPDEAQASLRAELERQISSAQAELEAQLANLTRAGLADSNPALMEELRGQLHVLSHLSQFLATAHGAALYQIRAEVATSVAATHSLSQQAEATIATAQATEAAKCAAEYARITDEARRTTENFVHDFYEKRIFDPYLHFASAQDEREYREREAVRQKAIAQAQAEHTPQGDMRAIELAQAQLKDAGTHGADRSPAYKDMDAELERNRLALKTANQPLQPDSRTQQASGEVRHPAADSNATVAPKILAALKNAGVTLADQSQNGHGVTVDASIAAVISRV